MSKRRGNAGTVAADRLTKGRAGRFPLKGESKGSALTTAANDGRRPGPDAVVADLEFSVLGDLSGGKWSCK